MKYIKKIIAAFMSSAILYSAFSSLSVNAETTLFVFGEDNWRFRNTSISFGDTYKFTENDYAVLKEKLTNVEMKMASDLIDGEFLGACYGMAALSILSCYDMIDYSMYNDNATSLYTMAELNPATAPNGMYEDADAPEDIASLCNYYLSLQFTEKIRQTVIKNRLETTETERFQQLIDNLEQGKPTLVAYFSEYAENGHAVVATSVEYGDYEVSVLVESEYDYDLAIFETKKFDGRIRVYNCNGYSDSESYIYFNTDDLSWHCGSLSSDNGASIAWIISDPELLNYKGLLNGNDIYEYNEEFVGVLTTNSVSSDYYKLYELHKNGNTIETVENNDAVIDFPSFLGEVSPAYCRDYALTNIEDIYGYKLEYNTPCRMELEMNYRNSLLLADASAAESVAFTEHSVSIALAEEKSDYTIDMVFNDEECNNNWYDISVAGKGKNADMEQYEKGYLLKSDGLENSVNVTIKSDDGTENYTLETEYDEVYICEDSNENFSVFADTDNDGEYESEIMISETLGDANQDGLLNVRDCALIASVLAKGKTDELPQKSDFNGDGKINVRDAAAIASHLANSSI